MSESWVNGFNHQGTSPILQSPKSCVWSTHRALVLTGWLDLQQYYISALKNGVYPSIIRDRVFLWARLHPANTNAPQDVIGKPSGWQYVGSLPALSLALGTV